MSNHCKGCGNYFGSDNLFNSQCRNCNNPDTKMCPKCGNYDVVWNKDSCSNCTKFHFTYGPLGENGVVLNEYWHVGSCRK